MISFNITAILIAICFISVLNEANAGNSCTAARGLAHDEVPRDPTTEARNQDILTQEQDAERINRNIRESGGVLDRTNPAFVEQEAILRNTSIRIKKDPIVRKICSALKLERQERILTVVRGWTENKGVDKIKEAYELYEKNFKKRKSGKAKAVQEEEQVVVENESSSEIYQSDLHKGKGKLQEADNPQQNQNVPVLTYNDVENIVGSIEYCYCTQCDCCSVDPSCLSDCSINCECSNDCKCKNNQVYSILLAICTGKVRCN